jgi:hypothetical protein
VIIPAAHKAYLKTIADQYQTQLRELAVLAEDFFRVRLGG